MLNRIKDWILGWLQRGCSHPGNMVAADLLEGGYRGGDVQLRWCQRCGAVRFTWPMGCMTPDPWRRPDPNLWR